MGRRYARTEAVVATGDLVIAQRTASMPSSPTPNVAATIGPFRSFCGIRSQRWNRIDAKASGNAARITHSARRQGRSDFVGSTWSCSAIAVSQSGPCGSLMPVSETIAFIAASSGRLRSGKGFRLAALSRVCAEKPKKARRKTTNPADVSGMTLEYAVAVWEVTGEDHVLGSHFAVWRLVWQCISAVQELVYHRVTKPTTWPCEADPSPIADVWVGARWA